MFRAHARSAAGQVEGAITDCTAALLLEPGDPTVYVNRGTSRFEIGDLAGAIADFDEAIRLDPLEAVAFYDPCTSQPLHELEAEAQERDG